MIVVALYFTVTLPNLATEPSFFLFQVSEGKEGPTTFFSKESGINIQYSVDRSYNSTGLVQVGNETVAVPRLRFPSSGSTFPIQWISVDVCVLEINRSVTAQSNGSSCKGLADSDYRAAVRLVDVRSWCFQIRHRWRNGPYRFTLLKVGGLVPALLLLLHPKTMKVEASAIHWVTNTQQVGCGTAVSVVGIEVIVPRVVGHQVVRAHCSAKPFKASSLEYDTCMYSSACYCLPIPVLIR